MKRLIVTCLAVSISASIFAQDGGTDRKVNMGIAYQLGLNFTKPGTKRIDKDGVGVQNAFGLNINFNFNDNIGFATGVEFDFESYKVSMNTLNGANYYLYSDNKIIQEEELNGDEANMSKYKVFELTGRKYKNIYATIPTMLIFRTNALGDFRYYGKFGARTSFLVKSTKTDQGNIFKVGNNEATGADIDAIAMNSSAVSSTGSEMEGMKTPYGNDISAIRCSLGVAGGTQWTFTGNTMLFAELGFYYGLTPINIEGSGKNKTLFNRTVGSPSSSDYFGLKTTQTQFCLKIGILF
ncbi:outer membrane beta-barrel protein [Fluviicola chungangensis]|uniref:Outer membrane beta-barrel protein n=1 Tax=Fluviicola chungangensis TaxID=2597671 RepID=A0A556N0N0_9FLAO|nr:outer membrane beta-barrel protein [Fluviicola chungangensis]TSJ45751.1 outer membrane beta-barrel protein [Fluviicola chungangensis]